MSTEHGEFTDPFQPEGPIDKWTPNRTDPLHNPQPLNPQPLPPGFLDKTTVQMPRDFPTGQATRQPMWGVGRGLRGPIGIVLVVVLVLGLLGLGIGAVVRSNQDSQPVLLSSLGVYAWEDSATLGQNSAVLTTPCKGTLASGIEQRVIGGGYTLSRSQVPLTARPVVAASSARSTTVNWDTSFVPGGSAAQLTNYAICLREPASFFNGATVQYEPSTMTTLAHPGPLPIKAACPAGTAVLGGGYVVQPLQQGGAQPPTIDSSFPYADDSGMGWEIVANSVNGFDKAQAWAVCSGALRTHLEFASVSNVGVFQRAITCSQGTLLGGGFDLLQPRGDNYFSTDYARQDSPGQTLKQDLVHGDTFSDWRVLGEINGIGSHYTATLWAVCWDQNGQPPVTAPTTAATAAPTQAPTVSATSAPTSTAVAAPTASPVPQPTKTTPPSCTVFHTDSKALSSPPPKYVNLDNGEVASTPTGQLAWLAAPGIVAMYEFAPVTNSGASLAGPLTTPYNGVTCAQLQGLTYTQKPIPDQNGEVFAVKLADGHYAKVQVIHPVVGGVTINWTTYKP
jgi:hypothetical protein